jgi:hypothetical protein
MHCRAPGLFNNGYPEAVGLARDAVKSNLKIDPKFSTQVYTQGMPFSDPAMHARRESALRKAGMPGKIKLKGSGSLEL